MGGRERDRNSPKRAGGLILGNGSETALKPASGTRAGDVPSPPSAPLLAQELESVAGRWRWAMGAPQLPSGIRPRSEVSSVD